MSANGATKFSLSSEATDAAGLLKVDSFDTALAQGLPQRLAFLSPERAVLLYGDEVTARRLLTG
jgi:hypothetical protein